MRITALHLTDHEARLIPERDATRLLLIPRHPTSPPESAIIGAMLGVDEAPESCFRAKLWIDLAETTPEAWTKFLEKLDLPENDRDVCQETLRFPQAEMLTNGGLALRLPMRNNWMDENNIYVNIVLLKHTLVTQHDGMLLPLDKVRRHLLEGDRPDVDNMPGLLLYVLQGIMEAGVNDLLTARGEVESMGDELEANPEALEGDAIRHRKHSVGHLTGQCEEQLFALTLLRSLLPHHPSLASIHKDAGELVDALNHTQRSLQRLEGRLADQLQQIDARMRNRTEQRLRLLTLVSAIFMPLTFITGFYGMNFENMEVLHSPWGYPVVIGLMLALGVGMVFFFRWRGWFK